jgi:pimeloyl-ACP methyl ester carboxylesterase
VTISRADSHPGILEKNFNAGGVRLNYAEGPATGPPLVLLHGLGRRWQVFMPLIPSLSLRWQIFAPDLRGHGKSARVPRGYRGLDYAADVVHFLRECVPPNPAIFGHSLGGMVAMWIGAQHPEVTRALILGDNAIDVQAFGNSMYVDLFTGLRSLAGSGRPVPEIARGIAEIRLRVPNIGVPVRIGDLPGNDQAYLEWWARCVSQADPDTYGMTLDGSSRDGWDGEGFLRRIACPTLLLQADPGVGGLMSDADVVLALRLLKHPVHVRFGNLGHGLYMQQPEPILRAITNFLDSLADVE